MTSIAYNDMLKKLRKRMSSGQLDALEAILRECREAVLVFIYNCVSYANGLGIENELISELYLQQEIEIFRNRNDDEQNEAPPTSA